MTVSENKKTILVIDDEQAARDLFVRTLGLKGFEVISSGSSEEAVDWAREIEPDLIFISLVLPGSNGLKVSKAVHAQDVLKKVPIVMLITHKGELDPKYTSTIGVVDVLVKPLSAEAISSVTLRILGEPAAKAAAGKANATIPAKNVPPDHSSRNESAEADDWDAEFAADNEKSPDNIEGQHVFQSGAEENNWGPEKGPEDLLKTGEPTQEKKDKDDILSKTDEPKIIMSSAEEPDYDEEDEIADELETSPAKKILTVFAVILVAGGLAFGAFSVRRFISFDSVVRLKDQITGTGSQSRGKAEVAAPQPKKEVPAPSPAAGLSKQEKASAASEPATKGSADVQVAAASRAAEPARKEPAPQSGTDTKAQKKTTFSVQVGFFSDDKNALLLVDKMKQKGYEAYVSEGQEKKGKRVLVGKFTDRKDAQEQLQALSRDGIKSIIIHIDRN